MKKIFPWALLSFLLGIALAFLVHRAKYPGGVILTDTVSTLTIIHDTVIKEIKTRVPYPVDVRDTVVLVPDTAAILAQYNKIYHYSDTVADSCLFAVIDDDVHMGSIVDRRFRYSLLCEKNITVTRDVCSRGFYAGPMAIGSKGSFSFGGSAMYTWERKALSLSVDALDREVAVSCLWKIGKH